MSARPHTLHQLADLHHQDLLRVAAAERIAHQLQHCAAGAAPVWSLRIAISAMAAWLGI